MNASKERKPRATIVDIARLAGVSKSTVSLVLKRSDLVRADTRARVREAMATLGYVYNRGAANLRMARSNMIGMVISNLGNPFFAEVAEGIEEAIYGTGYVPLLANTREDRAREREVLRTMSEQGVAGILLSPTDSRDPALPDELRQLAMPVVTMMRRVEGSTLPYVGQDNAGGEQRAAEHLVGLGHRRIAFLCGYASMSTHADRVEGYRAALDAHGIPLDPALVIEGFPDRAGGVEAIRRALSLAPRPTAALGFNDVVAIGAIGELARRGIQVGRDFAIIGFDDIAEAAYTSPALTTVRAGTKSLAGEAAAMLLSLIGGAEAPTEPRVGAAHLMLRESCVPHADVWRRSA